MKKLDKISFVIPVYNEELNIEPLYNELTPIANSLNKSYEIIFIDDASTDSTLKTIKTLTNISKKIKYISLEKNSGQSAALYAGFSYASGDIIITMDGDLQNDPGDIPHLLSYYGEDKYDMVNGWRSERKDTLSKKIASKIGNSVRNFFTKDNIKDTGCSLKIMRSSMLKDIKIFTGLHRFLPALMIMQGAKVIEIKVNHRERESGSSKYNNMRRAREGLYDLFAVTWMIKRNIKTKVKEKNIG